MDDSIVCKSTYRNKKYIFVYQSLPRYLIQIILKYFTKYGIIIYTFDFPLLASLIPCARRIKSILQNILYLLHKALPKHVSLPRLLRVLYF